MVFNKEFKNKILSGVKVATIRASQKMEVGKEYPLCFVSELQIKKK